VKLRHLDASFIGNYRPGGHTQLPSVEGAQGVMFQCPLCAQGKKQVVLKGGSGYVEGAHYVMCWFANPRNADRVPDEAFPKPGRWEFAGDTLDELTFVGPAAASVHLASPNGCGWHGFVRNGDAT